MCSKQCPVRSMQGAHGPCIEHSALLATFGSEPLPSRKKVDFRTGTFVDFFFHVFFFFFGGRGRALEPNFFFWGTSEPLCAGFGVVRVFLFNVVNSGSALKSGSRVQGSARSDTGALLRSQSTSLESDQSRKPLRVNSHPPINWLVKCKN